MSKLTLDKAIKHLEDDIPNIKCKECKEEHEQLLKWLKALKIITNKNIDIEKIKHLELLKVYEFYVYCENQTRTYKLDLPTKDEFDLLKEVFR